MKDCPACRIELTTLLLSREVYIDYCKRCKGSWFDAKELESVHKEDPVLQSIIATTKLQIAGITCSCGYTNPRSHQHCDVCKKELHLDCPVCNVALQEKSIGKLVIDRCEKCRGVWLDGGELTTLFDEFHRVVQLQKKSEGRSSDTATNVAALSLDALIWAPELLFYAGGALVDLAKHAPDALDAAGNLPELAAAGAEAAGTVIEGTVEVLSQAPEAAGAVMELFKDFIEAILGMLSD